jgi:hypothetical protein
MRSVPNPLGELLTMSADEDTIRTEKRFLGSLNIPFTTIYMEGKVYGEFKVLRPLE